MGPQLIESKAKANKKSDMHMHDSGDEAYACFIK
jgi:hypothetical protein